MRSTLRWLRTLSQSRDAVYVLSEAQRIVCRNSGATSSSSTVKLEGTDAANVTVSITTTVRSMGPVVWESQPPAPNNYPISHLAIWLLGLGALASLALRRRRATVTFASVLFLALRWTACGGGGTTTTSTTTGTPACAYSLSVTGTTESVVHTADLTLVVK